MVITTEQVKELREQTGVSVMQCRKALEEAGGDLEKAVILLKKKSSEIALKKADREAADGVVVATQGDGKLAMLELNCETDFVAKNEDFTNLANALVAKLLEVGTDGMSAVSEEMISPVIQKIGENIKLGKTVVLEGSSLGSYVHNGKTGVVVSLSGGTSELAKDIAMHIAAMKPEFISKEEIPADTIAKVEEVAKEEISKIDKPEEIKQKMLEGKVSSYFKEITLLEQPFIKNGDVTVGQLLTNSGAKIVAHSLYKI
jgi:elongation factor Ts